MLKETIEECLKWKGFTDDDFYTYKNMRFLKWEQDKDQELFYGNRINGRLHSVFFHELNLPHGDTHPLQWLLCGESTREQMEEIHEDPDALIHDILHHDVPIPVDCGGVSDSFWKNLKDMETMRIWINFPVNRRIMSNRARCLFYCSPYENQLLDEYSVNWLKKAMQIYAKVAEEPIYKVIVNKYNWNE